MHYVNHVKVPICPYLVDNFSDFFLDFVIIFPDFK